MTLRVPSSAASMKGTGSSCHGVCTMRRAVVFDGAERIGNYVPNTIDHAHAQRAAVAESDGTASSGMNFGSVVITVLPAALCGSSSLARSRL